MYIIQYVELQILLGKMLFDQRDNKQCSNNVYYATQLF